MKRWSVPFVTKTTDIWEVEANTLSEATMLGVLARQRYLDALGVTGSMIEEHPDRPTHTHSDASIGVTKATIVDESTVPGGELALQSDA